VALTTAWLWAGDRLAAQLLTDRPVPLTPGQSFALAGAHAVVAGALAAGLLALAGLWWASRRIWRAPDGGPRPVVAGLLAAALALLPALVLGAALVRGEWIGEQPWAPILRWGVVPIVAAAAFLFGWLAIGWSRGGGRRALWFVAAALAAALGAGLADALVFPGLYPEAHLGLYLTGGLAALAAAVRVADGALPRADRARLLALVLLLAPAGAAATAWLAAGDASRAAIALASPNVSETMRWTGGRGPSPSSLGALARLGGDDAAAAADDPHPLAALVAGRADWNVLVVVVDAMRADALAPGRRAGAITADGDTPFLDGWLEGTYRFRRAYSPASATHLAMPAIFEARDAGDMATPGGVPVAERFRELGRTPVAVVAHWFLLPVRLSASALLDGFEQVRFVPNDQQQRLPALVDEVLRDTPRPFFAWVHPYTLHEPYFAERLLTSGSARSRYQQAIRYTDGLLAELFAVLDRQGLADDTIVVLLADHGETFGEHRKTGHGATVFDEDIGVPLAIRIPGTPGALLEQTVGTVDVLPTLVELLGGAMEPGVEGRSLVPLLADPERSWDRAYGLSSGHRKARGVVRGRAKLVYDERPDMFFLFDLVADPNEVTSILGQEHPAEAPLFDAFYVHHPDRIGRALDDPELRRLLETKLSAIDPRAPREALAGLLRIVAQHPSPGALTALEGLFRGANDDATRLLVVRALARAAPTRAATLLSAHLERLSDDAAAAARFVDGLRRQRQPSFAPDEVRRGLQAALAAGAPDRVRPWLALVRPWDKPFGTWAPVLVRAEAVLRDDEAGLRLVCQNVASLQGVPVDPGPKERLGAALAAYVDHPDTTLSAAAIRALGRLRYQPVAASLHARADQPGAPVRVRQALVHALAAIEQEDATPAIIELGADPLLAFDAVQALQPLADDRALPFLDEVAKTHAMADIRREAKSAAAAVRKKLGIQQG
jgi:hypothetical protein